MEFVKKNFKAYSTLDAARRLIAKINQEIESLPEPREPDDDIEFEIPSDISIMVPVPFTD